LGKGNALETEKISLVLPKTMLTKLEALKTVYGAMSVQDVIRSILAEVLPTKKATKP
jgi:hypothetical protein